MYVHSSAQGAKPITRKGKQSFETAHKIPPSLTYKLNKKLTEDVKQEKEHKLIKREASPAESPAPAPAGAIKLDVAKLLAKYKTELKTSTTTTTTKRPKSRRVKKDATVTLPTPVLTTGAPVKRAVDDDFTLDGAASEKQRSRIQIKKGPNGQEYEYEYVYYYYDDDDDDKSTKEKTFNSHDGPAREKSDTTKSDKSKTQAPDANEVIPSNRGRGNSRGRQLDEEDDERLPANTRFPPRGRNIDTTPSSAEEGSKTSRGRTRNKPSESAEDNYSEETQVSFLYLILKKCAN